MVALPNDWPITGVGLLALTFLNVFQLLKVSGQRKKAQVAYPALYADAAEAKADPEKFKFNCIQRAHANTLEYIPYIMGMFAYTGVFHPKPATAVVCAWAFGRVFYTLGYATGNPAARNGGLGALAGLSSIALFFGTIYTVATQVIALNLF